MKPPKGFSIAPGFSIAECLITMAVMGVLLAPLTMSLSQSVQLHRKLQYTHSRSLLMDSFISQVSGGINTFNTAFNDVSATFSQNTANLCSMAKVNPTGSSIFSRQALLYVYDPQADNTCGAVGAGAKDAVPVTVQTDAYYLDVGNNTTTDYRIDAQGNVWQPDVAYDAGNRVGGYVAAGTVPPAANGTLTNVPTASQAIYKDWRQDNDLHYSLPLKRGSYWVELHLADWDNTVSRRSDIYLENSLVAANFSPFEGAGSDLTHKKAIILKYTIDVNDGDGDTNDLLDIKLIKTGASPVGLAGLAVYPKGAQGL
jgi:type II secretory pathway pseudopilin PulG